MISSLGQVMLYVNDMEASAQFWREKVGFERVERQKQGTQISYKIDSEVQLVLHDKPAVTAMNPDMNLATPSILMSSINLEKTYQEFIAKGINVNPIIDLGCMKVFNFSDDEDNYFAVREVS
ncbi:VOC family protein [Streptococcus ruminantium]|uniref:VOC family protein n=1 Tax=Streptococcus ruminantium TaxID=1917441 RepID=UPI00280DC610|nr:VOC family protein [Streptococcus ruminantium]MDQ8820476.1 VOC family protein [Streptococcus ruminantium]MDQ8837578.1 VOC family protein [Streptococcus ruminantium]